MENSIEEKLCINIEIKSLELTFSYTYVTMNMKLLAVVTPTYIYHGCSTRKTFWEEKFTGEEKFTLGGFSALNMKSCGCCNVRKYREIKGSDEYVTLEILLKFDSMDNMRITSSYSKVKFGRSGKGLITSMSLKSKKFQRNVKRQGMPSEMSARRTFKRLLGSLKNYLKKVIRRRGPNMSLLTVTFT